MFVPNSAELTGINNEEIVYTLFNIFRYIDITPKELINKGLNSNKKHRF